jgi:hypothetical protein
MILKCGIFLKHIPALEMNNIWINVLFSAMNTKYIDHQSNKIRFYCKEILFDASSWPRKISQTTLYLVMKKVSILLKVYVDILNPAICKYAKYLL